MASNIVDNVIDSSGDRHMKLLKFQVDTDEMTCLVTGWNDVEGINKVIDIINVEYGGSLSLNIKSSIRYNGKSYNVVGIAPGAFSAGTTVNSIFELNTVYLNEVTLPDSVTSIGDEAFRDNKLRRINFDKNLLHIGDLAFSYCTNLGIDDDGELNIPATAELGTYVFVGCTSLVHVSIGDTTNAVVDGYTLNEIPEGTFRDCTNLIVCTFWRKSGNAIIGDNAFNRCSNLRYVELPLAWFVSIGDSAFEDCIKFEALWDQGPFYSPMSEDIIYYTSPVSIGNYAFKNCNNLRSLPFSSRICKMGEGAFELCWNLEHFDFVGSTTVSTEEGDGTLLTEIPEKAFAGCASLSQIYIPASCVSIDNHAFDGCSRLRDVFIPSATFSRFGDASFFNCSSLKRVWLLSNNINNITFSSNTFLGTPEHKQLILNSSVIDNSQIGDYVDWEASFGTTWEVSSEKSTIIYKPESAIDNPEEHEFIVEIVRSNSAGTTLSYAKIVGLLNQNSMDSGIVRIPETVNYNGTNYNVTAIGDETFVNNFRLVEVEIPTTLKTIGRCAFLNCYNLRKISGTLVNVFPIENIEPYAFAHCRYLNRINNDQNTLTNLKLIGEGTFIGCNSLGKINVTSLGSLGGTPVLPARTFAHCGALTVTKTTGTSVFEDTEIVNYDRSTFYGTTVTIIQ